MIEFHHRQSAHCESGVTSNLLYFYGVDCSEALAFGIGDGLFFGYLPFIRVNKLPLTTFRCSVGTIFNKVSKRLGVTVRRKKFRSPAKAMDELDKKLDQGIPVGCQTGAYWLPYFPPAFRFHFNMHNLVVLGREGSDYIISDPVFDDLVRCHRSDLIKARFAKGALAPKGAMYYLEHVPDSPDIQQAVATGITSVSKIMLKTPVPFLGVRGINFLANRLAGWPKKLGAENAALHLGQLIRMQEEIGTGGGGFRFIYAAFLQEAAAVLEKQELARLSNQMTLTGDKWRGFATLGARVCKGRAKDEDVYDRLADMLRECAQQETAIYRELGEIAAL
ncbi:peptidase [Desulfomarina profundi]|uniref:Peptidase n=1 Tax=Desulfomarina profundi TaxID=2772557 RepID=A0A8D5JDV1_9BACT|nr:BtrH N-terminal domain-containing protein [Desulfomarina profundi]BCL61638.1 peptidase [Desulfomarina profundi]